MFASRALKRVIVGATLALLIGSLVSGASAAAWPSRPITMVIGWSAGGGSDITARMLFPYVEKILGATIVIVNKPGAAGEISFVELAHARPDGYTWAWTNTPNSVAIPIMRKTNYKLEDFEPCANIIYDPGVIVVRPESPFKTMQDLLDYARKHPSVVTVSTSGLGSDDCIAVRTICRVAGVKLTEVPFEGAGANIPALLGGHVSAGAINVSEVKPYIEGGKMRALAVLDDRRSHLIPDVPTLKELGYDIVSGSARGFSAPKGTPKEIVDKMVKAVEEALNNPEFKEKAEKGYQLIRFMGPEEYKKYLYDLRETLTQMYKENPW